MFRHHSGNKQQRGEWASKGKQNYVDLPSYNTLRRSEPRAFLLWDEFANHSQLGSSKLKISCFCHADKSEDVYCVETVESWFLISCEMSWGSVLSQGQPCCGFFCCIRCSWEAHSALLCLAACLVYTNSLSVNKCTHVCTRYLKGCVFPYPQHKQADEVTQKTSS